MTEELERSKQKRGGHRGVTMRFMKVISLARFNRREQTKTTHSTLWPTTGETTDFKGHIECMPDGGHWTRYN